jgi:phytoene synthase
LSEHRPIPWFVAGQAQGAAAFDLAPCDLAACHELLRVGSKSFFAASRLLPRDVREPATALYAFCRIADDAIDLADDPAAALAALQHRLDAIYAGRPAPHGVDRCMAKVVRAHAIPRAIVEALFEGFAWDAEGRIYADEDELVAYCARVAATVGVMMTLLMGVRAPDVLARACDLGVAMQLTNIARDVGEDARAGRLYLPTEWMAAEGVDVDAWRRAPVFDARIARVVERLLERAHALYARSQAGVEALPRDCRAAIQSARLVYAEIGRKVAANGHDSVSQRAFVPLSRKLALIARAMTPAGPHPAVLHAPPLGPVAFLIEAVVKAPRGGRVRQPTEGVLARLISFRARTVGVVALLERVELRRMGRDGRLPSRLINDIATAHPGGSP